MEGAVMNEDKVQALLVSASELEVGQAMIVSRSEDTEHVLRALATLYYDRTFHIKPYELNPDMLQLSRCLYEGDPNVI